MKTKEQAFNDWYAQDPDYSDGTRHAFYAGFEAAQPQPDVEARAQELTLEIERLKKLIEIADVLITNDNAKEDWENAKRIRVM